MPATTTGIAYDDRGSGDLALLFLPGWCGPRTLFEPLMARLDDRVRTLAVDWRGHGDSGEADGDFGLAEMVDDAVAVVEEAGVATVVPVTVAHAGWAGLELRRRLGPERVPRLVLLDWMVLGAPPPFLDALATMADLATTRQVVDRVCAGWSGGREIPPLLDYVASMAAFPDEMWARGAREIAASFDEHGSPLAALTTLEQPPATLHLYAQPADPAFLAAQEAFAAEHPWFRVERLDAVSHFPVFEVPDDIAGRLADVARSPRPTAVDA